MAIDAKLLKNIIEAALLVNHKPQTLKQLESLFEGENPAPTRAEITEALDTLASDYADRGVELKQVASGYRVQARQELEPWVSRLFQEKPPRYSRALLETLALVAYRQPVTRSEIETVRGVSVSSHIIKTLLEREWIRVVAHKEVPGRPAMYGTTREFLDYFNIQSIEELPPLAELKDFSEFEPEAAAAEATEQTEAETAEDVSPQVDPDADAIIIESQGEPERAQSEEKDMLAELALGAEHLEEDNTVPEGESVH